jgi:hypothetical protein
MGFAWLCLLIAGSAWAQNSPPKLGIQVGASVWFNNCDVPAGGQDTGIQPSFGPSFQLTYKKFRIGGTFYTGNFHIEPEDGLIFGSKLNPPIFGTVSNDTILYSDEEARKRGFTSIGDTKRIDFTLNAGYAFSRYAVLAFSLIVNRHKVDVFTYWPPTNDINNKITNLPIDRPAPFRYTDTQYWLGQYFSGSVPVETVSTRFSIFYGAGLLVILGESGEGVAIHPSGNPVVDVGPRMSYTNEQGQVKFPPRPLGTRSFGENAGVTFNTGAGFQLFKDIGLYGGYNFKFFSEDETDLIDHSRFHGPFFGIDWKLK